MKLKNYKPKSQCVTTITRLDEKRLYFDAHVHFGKLLLGESYDNLYDLNEYINKAKESGMLGVINLDGFWGEELEKMMYFTSEYRDFIYNFMWVDFSDVDNENFEKNTKKSLEEGLKLGVKGIKIWKDVTLEFRDSNNNPIWLDSDRYKFIFEFASEHNWPVLIHIGDPKAFFEPLDETNERYEELIENPSWHFYKKHEALTFDRLLKMQENLIANNPNTTFLIAHVGSFAENLSYVSEQLDKYSNLYIDISARIAELGRVPYTSKRFFEKHQDQILFGSDFTPVTDMSEYQYYFRFLETMDENFPYSSSEKPGQGRWRICGIGLSEDILNKIYYKNAYKVLGLSK